MTRLRRRESAADAAMRGCEAIVHLANRAHGAGGAADLREVNVDGTRRIAEQSARHGVRRLVYLSSLKAIAEETRAPIDGTEPPAPQDDYGRTKLAAEQVLAEVRFSTDLEVAILRPPLVYGPGVKANFLALLQAIDRAWPLPFASIRNRRSFLYVGNLVSAILASLESPNAAGRTYVLSDGAPLSTPELCTRLGEALGRPARLFAFAPALLELVPSMKRLTRSLEVNDYAIRAELAWQPPFTTADGLRATAAWHRG